MAESIRVRPPEHLASQHDLAAFRNGKYASLDDWLKQRALASEGLSARTYVICSAETPARVVGYYAISTALEERTVLPSARLRHGTPERIPVLLIGRLAVDRTYQGRGVGSALLIDAVKRCLAVSEMAGMRGIIAHAIDDEAATFYSRHGFLLSPLSVRLMLMSVETARALLQP